MQRINLALNVNEHYLCILCLDDDCKIDQTDKVSGRAGEFDRALGGSLPRRRLKTLQIMTRLLFDHPQFTCALLS